VFKNEGHAIREWLDHHIREGVDTFFLTDNGSTDTYDIQDYIDNGTVILRKDDKKAQKEHLNYYLKDAKKYHWVIVIDLDEFIYSRLGFKTIKDYLKTVDKNIYLIQLPWKIFGSNHRIKQPKSIIRGFTRRKKHKDNIDTLHDDYVECKCIVRGSKLIKLDIHVPTVKDINFLNHRTMTTNHTDVLNSATFALATENILKTSCLHLNHYRIQSWDFFRKVKMTRGNAIQNQLNNFRDKKYFKQMDYNDIVDTELKRKTLKNKYN
jgi:hypothetical protein